MMLAQHVPRQREIAVRLALGAGRAGLVRQFFAEGLTLAFAGALLSLLVAHAALAALRFFAAGTIPRAQTIAIDPITLAFAAAVAMVAGLFFGLVPMLQARRTDVQHHLRGGRGAKAPELRRWQAGLTMGEIALALMVVVMAGLLGRSFGAIPATDETRTTDAPRGASARPRGEVVTLRLSLPERYAEPARARAFHAALLPRLELLPGRRRRPPSASRRSPGWRSGIGSTRRPIRRMDGSRWRSGAP